MLSSASSGSHNTDCRGQAASLLTRKGINFYEIGEWQEEERKLTLKLSSYTLDIDIDKMRDVWYKTSYLFDQLQSGEKLPKILSIQTPAPHLSFSQRFLR